jgi:hypothetical protein
MAGRIISLPLDPHRRAQSLLPWYVRGQLEPEEQAQLEAHLEGCAECRAELDFENRLRAGLKDMPLDPEQGWARMKRRIHEAQAEDDRIATASRSPRPAAAPGWVPWAFAAQLLLMVLGAGALAVWLQPARYHTLSSSERRPGGDMVVMFKPETTEATAQTILRTNKARIIDGPTAAGAYVLATPEVEREQTLARLRADPHLILAEPIANTTAP